MLLYNYCLFKEGTFEWKYSRDFEIEIKTLKMSKNILRTMEALKVMNSEIHTENKVNDKLGLISGLGGWLIVTQIALFLSLFTIGINLVNFWRDISGTDTWEFLTSGDKGYITLIITYNTLLFLFLIFIIIQFYRKKTMVPRMIVIMYSINIAMGIINFIVFQQVSYAADAESTILMRNMIRAIIAGAIWIPYFLKSERVENTFVA
jgi:hypothetical protein